MYYQSILETVGQTPLVKLQRIGKELKCNVFAKCEFFNPGGSVKDRIAKKMIEDAEKEGRIKPGDTLIEPTSGNTGIGLALAGAVKGYNVIITMPEKMSREKQVVLEALGAKIIRTPTEAAWDAPESHIGVAKKLEAELPNAHILDQYSNPSNPLAHYEGTAGEIIEGLDGKIDMVVMGAGTGGTLSGVAKRIKEHNPDCIIIGADPEGSILAGGQDVHSYKVEGIGYDFIPEVLDRGLVDRWVKTNDRESFLLARRLISEEGLLCGGSSGSAMAATLREAVSLGPDQNCVVILPDGVRNYMTKFVDDRWMSENHFVRQDGMEGTVQDLMLADPDRKAVCIDSSASVTEAIDLMSRHGFSQLPVTSGDILVGIINEKTLLEDMMSGRCYNTNKVSEVAKLQVGTVQPSTPLLTLQDIFTQFGCAVIVDQDQHPLKLVTKIDLVKWIGKSGKREITS